MPQLEIKAICFDMDGLLFNTEELYDELSLEMLRRRGKEYDPNLVRRIMGLQPEPALRMFIDHYELPDSIDDLKAEGDEFFEAVLPDRLALLPGAMELLEFLSDESPRPLALTTSSGRTSVERIMSICDIQHFFEFWLTAKTSTKANLTPKSTKRPPPDTAWKPTKCWCSKTAKTAAELEWQLARMWWRSPANRNTTIPEVCSLRRRLRTNESGDYSTDVARRGLIDAPSIG